MSTFLAKVKYLVHNIPAPVRVAVEHVAIVAATTFVATAKPLLPQLVGDPSLSTTKAAVLTCATAALVAGYHAAKAMSKQLASKWQAIPVVAPAKEPTTITPPAA